MYILTGKGKRYKDRLLASEKGFAVWRILDSIGRGQTPLELAIYLGPLTGRGREKSLERFLAAMDTLESQGYIKEVD